MCSGSSICNGRRTPRKDSGMNLTIGDIDKLTRNYSEAHARLAKLVEELEAEITTVRNRRLGFIRRAAEGAANRKAELAQAIEENPELFKRPKTIVLHGIKVGFQKGKGKVTWAKQEQVVRLIKKHMPDQESVLIATEEKPVRPALVKLPAADLKRIACQLEDAGDQVVIRPTDSDIEKLVDAILKESEPADLGGSAA